jgi:Zn-dependent protease
MTDPNDTVRRGPWDRPADPAVVSPAPVERPPIQPDLVKGQHPAWALVSTALLSGFIWWISGSWVIAVAAIFGLLVHEYGHVLAMNRLGMGPAKIYIIPFLGGVARGQRMPVSEWDGVLVSLAGPAFGILAAIPFFALGAYTAQAEWFVGAAAIAAINLINLAPAPPLDGSKALGPVLARIHPMVEMAVMVLIGLAVVAWGVMNGSYIFAVFLALALIGHLRRGTWRPEGRQLTWREAGMSVGLFLVTAILCAGVGVAALAPLTDGSIGGALEISGRYFGIGR